MNNAQFPKEQTADGSFKRQEDAFRDWVTADGSSGYPAQAGRYHLYVSLACPWACRTVIVRKLKGLEEAIGMTVVDPIRDERGWRFTAQPDPVNGWAFLSEAYTATDPGYNARVTVPVLWDKERGRIVSNSDDDIMRMFETQFDAVATNPQLDLYPSDLRLQIDELNDFLYETFNNGVYRAGFATSQAAYERAAYEVFTTIDAMEERLAYQRYLLGARPVETDWRFFVTLVRFDPVYYGHFKCNLRRVVDYPNLYGYLRDLYQIDGVAETVEFDQIKRHYYITQDEINPTGIVPIGPIMDLAEPHDRDRLDFKT
ncbi:MAG TPA: glutathione S-transferase family protein [Candidatus Cybelea sp.]|nr:glutathione S-transferase family protein [Candidatus Cybelea sp.]